VPGGTAFKQAHSNGFSNRWQAEGLREDLADPYVESSDAEAGEEFNDRTQRPE